jgi:hypothetical protein
MDTVAIALLVVVLLVQVYVSFFKSAGPAGDDKSSALLLEDLRRQLGEANATAERERTAKGDAQSRASGAESARMRRTSSSPKPSRPTSAPPPSSARTIPRR